MQKYLEDLIQIKIKTVHSDNEVGDYNLTEQIIIIFPVEGSNILNHLVV